MLSSTEAGIDTNEATMRHIISWFEGTENPILTSESIQGIRVLGDSISFWYGNKLCNCPVRERGEFDSISFVPMESFEVETLRMRVRTDVRSLVAHHIGAFDGVKDTSMVTV